MIARAAIVFVGFIVFGAFLNLFSICSTMFFALVLGITDPSFHQIQYWASFATAAVITLILMIRVWPKEGPAPYAKRNQPSDATAAAEADAADARE